MNKRGALRHGRYQARRGRQDRRLRRTPDSPIPSHCVSVHLQAGQRPNPPLQALGATASARNSFQLSPAEMITSAGGESGRRLAYSLTPTRQPPTRLGTSSSSKVSRAARRTLKSKCLQYRLRTGRDLAGLQGTVCRHRRHQRAASQRLRRPARKAGAGGPGSCTGATSQPIVQGSPPASGMQLARTVAAGAGY